MATSLDGGGSEQLEVSSDWTISRMPYLHDSILFPVTEKWRSNERPYHGTDPEG